MKLTRRFSTSSLPPLALIVALTGCAGSASGIKETTGTGGSTGGGCQTVGCVPKILTPLELAVEIAPPSASGAGITEKPNQLLNPSNGSLLLAADSIISVTATFTAASNAPIPSNANILLDIPSAILGRPDLTFQAAASSASASTSTAQLSIPEGPINASAAGTLSLIPLPPSDQQSAPYSTPVMLQANVPLAADLPSDTFTIGGTLVNPLQKAPTNAFVARAYQGGLQVSNAPVTDSTGAFLLTLPLTVGMTGGSFTIQLSPQSPQDPQFLFDPLMLSNPPPQKVSLGTVMLEAYQLTNTYNVPVVTADAAQTQVSGVLVQMQTNLGKTSSNGQTVASGSTQFARSGTTNAQGIASLSLLPGSPSSVITYTAVVIPPAGSSYATTCTTIMDDEPGAASVNTPGAPSLEPATVSARATISGRIEDSGGHPVANVAIAATPTSGTVAGCPGTTPQPASATSDGQGNYSLYVDPGTTDEPVTYQLDFDPPAGSAAPRLTQTGLAVSGNGSNQTHNVTLPAGGLVAGIVTDSAQPPNTISSATVRLFQTQCSSAPCSTPPILRGQAVTDSQGKFQIVVSVSQ